MCLGEASSNKRVRMEEQIFSKLGALTLSLDISNVGEGGEGGEGGEVGGAGAGAGRGALRGAGGRAGGRGARAAKKAVHVKLDLGALGLGGLGGARDPLRENPAAAGIWDQIHGSVAAAQPWSLEIRRATPEMVCGLESTVLSSGRLQHLVSLSLRSGRGVGDEGGRALAHALRESVPCLRALNLSGNNLGVAAAGALAEALLSGGGERRRGGGGGHGWWRGCALEELDLSENNIGSEGACSLAGALVNVGCPHLRKLDLTQNFIGARWGQVHKARHVV